MVPVGQLAAGKVPLGCVGGGCSIIRRFVRVLLVLIAATSFIAMVDFPQAAK